METIDLKFKDGLNVSRKENGNLIIKRKVLNRIYEYVITEDDAYCHFCNQKMKKKNFWSRHIRSAKHRLQEERYWAIRCFNVLPCKIEFTRYGNELLSNVKNTFFHKPRKEQYTTIIEFEVIKPQHGNETIGERLKLSMFGEYCPDNSLRGYSLEELLTRPKYYRPKVIAQMGEKISLNYH